MATGGHYNTVRYEISHVLDVFWMVWRDIYKAVLSHSFSKMH